MDSHGDPGPSTMENRTLAQAPRVSQVDADDLDESLVSMLSERLQKSLGNFKVGVAPGPVWYSPDTQIDHAWTGSSA